MENIFFEKKYFLCVYLTNVLLIYKTSPLTIVHNKREICIQIYGRSTTILTSFTVKRNLTRISVQHNERNLCYPFLS